MLQKENNNAQKISYCVCRVHFCFVYIYKIKALPP